MTQYPKEWSTEDINRYEKFRAWEYSPEGISYRADILFALGDDQLRDLVSVALSYAPHEVIDYTLDNAVMLMPRSEEKGCHIPNYLFGGKDIIAFPETLLEEPKEEAYFTILHEVAHLWLGHKSPLVDDLTMEESDRGEKEADALARQWLESKGGYDTLPQG